MLDIFTNILLELIPGSDAIFNELITGTVISHVYLVAEPEATVRAALVQCNRDGDIWCSPISENWEVATLAELEVNMTQPDSLERLAGWLIAVRKLAVMSIIVTKAYCK